MQKITAYLCILAICYGFVKHDFYTALTLFVAVFGIGTGLAIAVGEKGTNISNKENLRKLQRGGGILVAIGTLAGAIYGGFRYGWTFSIVGFITGLVLMCLIGYISGIFKDVDSNSELAIFNSSTTTNHDTANDEMHMRYAMTAWKASTDLSPEVRAVEQQRVKNMFPGGAEGFEKMMHQMITSLRSNNEAQVNMSITVMRGLGEISIPYLTALLSDPDQDIRMKAGFILNIIALEQDQIIR